MFEMLQKGKKRRDGMTDVVRVLYWYRFISGQLGTTAPLAIKRIVEQEDGKPSYADRIPDARYHNYSRGEQVPRAATVDRAEEVAPGSKNVLNHVIWPVLRDDMMITKHRAKKLIGELAPGVRALMFNARGGIRMDADCQRLESLLVQGGLDTVAALTILIRLRHHLVEVEAHCREFVLYEYGISLLRALLIAGRDFEEIGLADEIFKIFVVRIFPLILEDQQMQFMLDTYPYVQVSKALHKHATEHISRTGPRASYRKILVHILNGTLSTSVTLTHMPLLGGDLRLGPPTRDSCALLKLQTLQLFDELAESDFLSMEYVGEDINYSCAVLHALDA